MAVYHYRAMDRDGRMHGGRVAAANVADLEGRLEKMGFDLVAFRERHAHARKASGKGVHRRDLITLFFHLEQASRAGVPLLENLVDLRDSTENHRLRGVIAAMIESVEGGKTLSGAMREFPAVFDDTLVALVRAGEQSGKIAEVFFSICENLKWQDELASRTRKLLIYPLFVGGVVAGVIFFLMIWLVPELLKFITAMGQELPLHTKALVAVSGLFVEYWYLMLCLPVVAGACLIAGARISPAIRYRLDHCKLEAPIIGPVIKKIILTRMAACFAMMYSSGITIIECVRAGEEIAGNRVIAQALRMVHRQITDGASLSASFENTGLFPPLVVRMIKIGESTGALENTLANIGYFYNRDVTEAIDRLQSLAEPVLTVILGSIIGWVMLSVLGPVYDLISKIRI